MAKQDATVNAGVHGAGGIEFQKYCALYLLFEKYDDLKDTMYFICLEHKDDFLFCYQDNKELIQSIDCYQAKKASKPWTLTKEVLGLIGKMTEIGLQLYEDNMPKTDNYKHNLIFITNNSVMLSNGKKQKQRKSIMINESNKQIKLKNLEKEIKENIKNKIKPFVTNNLTELNNVLVEYIDMPKTSKSQKDSLVGQCSRIFRDEISDHVAAVDTILLLFRDAENTLNQGNVAKLMDKSKRVNCEAIDNTFNLLTTKKMAFELWRKEKDTICNKLNIPLSRQKKFKLDFENSFDRFKDLKQQEHIKILDFVKENREVFDTFTDEIECIKELYKRCEENLSSQLSELNLKAAIYAAYIEESGSF